MARTIGTPGADSLAGSAEADLLLGRGGDDQLDGLGGADLVLGGVGNDRIFGESSASGLPYPPPPGGDDVLLGGTGNDTIIGGSRPGDPQDGQDLILGGPGNDSLDGGGGTNTVLGGAGDDTIENASLAFGGPGDDRIFATLGSDTVLGGNGNDLISGFGLLLPVSFRAFPEIQRNDAADLLLGGAGSDALNGFGGADILLGGTGNDVLVGGFGADRLTGGPGADLFVLAPIPAPFQDPVPDSGVGPGNRQVVTDFQQGCDRLDFSRYDDPSLYYSPPPPWPEPVFLDSGAFTTSTGLQVRSEVLEDGSTLVQYLAPRRVAPGAEPGLPAGPTGEVELAGTFHLTQDDLILRGPAHPSASVESQHAEAQLPASAVAMLPLDWLGLL